MSQNNCPHDIYAEWENKLGIKFKFCHMCGKELYFEKGEWKYLEELS